MDYIAKAILEVLTEDGMDAAYLADKAERLSNMNRFQVLTWANNLDQINREALAKKLGVDFSHFDFVIQFLRKL